MRSIHLALATAVVAVAVSAGSAQAQTTKSSSVNVVIKSDANGKPVIFSSNAGSGDNTATLMEGIALTGSQREALAKIDSTHAKALADADAQHLAAVRALLTPAQRDRFEKNQTAQKEQLALMEKMTQVNADNAQKIGQLMQGAVQIQFGGDVKVTPDDTPAEQKSDK